MENMITIRELTHTKSIKNVAHKRYNVFVILNGVPVSPCFDNAGQIHTCEMYHDMAWAMAVKLQDSLKFPIVDESK